MQRKVKTPSLDDSLLRLPLRVPIEAKQDAHVNTDITVSIAHFETLKVVFEDSVVAGSRSAEGGNHHGGGGAYLLSGGGSSPRISTDDPLSRYFKGTSMENAAKSGGTNGGGVVALATADALDRELNTWWKGVAEQLRMENLELRTANIQKEQQVQEAGEQANDTVDAALRKQQVRHDEELHTWKLRCGELENRLAEERDMNEAFRKSEKIGAQGFSSPINNNMAPGSSPSPARDGSSPGGGRSPSYHSTFQGIGGAMPHESSLVRSLRAEIAVLKQKLKDREGRNSDLQAMLKAHQHASSTRGSYIVDASNKGATRMSTEQLAALLGSSAIE